MMNQLINSIHQELLPGLQVKSFDPHNPVVVQQFQLPGSYLGQGTTPQCSTALAIQSKW